MNDDVNQFARELVGSIAEAVADDQSVRACYGKARPAGFGMRISLEAVIGFANRSDPSSLVKVGRTTEASAKRTDLEFSTSDRRFLRSLRIAVGTAIHDVEQEPR